MGTELRKSTPRILRWGSAQFSTKRAPSTSATFERKFLLGKREESSDQIFSPPHIAKGRNTKLENSDTLRYNEPYRFLPFSTEISK